MGLLDGNFNTNDFSAIANVAELSFTQHKILSFERPPIKSFASTNPAPLLRAYRIQGTVADPLLFAVRGIFDSPTIQNTHIVDRLLLPTFRQNERGYVFERPNAFNAAQFSEDPLQGLSYCERFQMGDFLELSGLI